MPGCRVIAGSGWSGAAWRCRRERRHREGRRLLPRDGQEAPAAQEIAAENKLPCVYLVDSGGAFLPMQDACSWTCTTSADLLQPGEPPPGTGLRRAGCTAGGAYVPGTSDETVIVRNQDQTPGRPAAGGGGHRGRSHPGGAGRRSSSHPHLRRDVTSRRTTSTPWRSSGASQGASP
ncbi:hypothetical protein QJS66_13590 [Kocuria rhizophila]|nr:hypothetical protein QJS66_13590 [Kocuria rhizophila]